MSADPACNTAPTEGAVNDYLVTGTARPGRLWSQRADPAATSLTDTTDRGGGFFSTVAGQSGRWSISVRTGDLAIVGVSLRHGSHL